MGAVRLYNRTLTEAEVQEDMFSAPLPGIAGSWSIDPSNSSRVVDLVGRLNGTSFGGVRSRRSFPYNLPIDTMRNNVIFDAPIAFHQLDSGSSPVRMDGINGRNLTFPNNPPYLVGLGNRVFYEPEEVRGFKMYGLNTPITFYPPVISADDFSIEFWYEAVNLISTSSTDSGWVVYPSSVGYLNRCSRRQKSCCRSRIRYSRGFMVRHNRLEYEPWMASCHCFG